MWACPNRAVTWISLPSDRCSFVSTGFYCNPIVSTRLLWASFVSGRASHCCFWATLGFQILPVQYIVQAMWFAFWKPGEARIQQREAQAEIIEARRSLALNNRMTIEAQILNRVVIWELFLSSARYISLPLTQARFNIRCYSLWYLVFCFNRLLL